MIELKIKLFGSFRNYYNQNTPLIMTLKSPANIKLIKIELSKQLSQLSNSFDQNGVLLVQDSAIANDTEILMSDAVIDKSCELSVLPPVCGG